MHFFVKLVLAAPASFFSAAWASQAAPAFFATESSTHFLVKLVLAAPASFFSAAWASQVAAAESDSHFFTKLVLAAPDSFLSVAAASHLLSAAWADTARAARRAEHRRRAFFMGSSRVVVAQLKHRRQTLANRMMFEGDSRRRPLGAECEVHGGKRMERGRV